MKKVVKSVVAIIIAVFVIYTFYFLWKQSQPKPVVYDLVQPTVTDVAKTAMATGEVNARVQVELKPQITGIITALRVKAGDHVKVGDVVAVIKVIPDMSELNQAQSQAEQASIKLQQVERDAARSQKLFDQGVVSREENEKQQNALKQAKEELEAAKCQIDVVTKGASKRSGNVNTTEVRSSMNGTVLDVPVKVGASVSGSSQFSSGTTIAVVGDMSDVIFVGNVDEASVSQLTKGMNMKLSIGAIQNSTVDATLEYISPEGKLVNGAKMFQIEGAIKVPEGMYLRSGYSANAVILLDEVKHTLAVNESAVVFEDGKPYVYKLVSKPEDTDDQKFERVPVTLGISDGINVQVKSGITKDVLLKGKQQ